MYEDFYQLQADPFSLSPDHHFCFTHSSYEKAKVYMEYGLRRAEGFVMITGKPGTGKTTLIYDLLDDPSLAKVTVAMLVSTQLEADDLLRMVAFSFGLKGDSPHKANVIQELIVFLTRHYRAGRRALLIVDEAQELSISAMEELRLLTNLQVNSQPLLQILLLGQEELRDLMEEPGMVQGHQRIVAACHLEPLKEEESTAYIRYRLCKVGWKGNPQISTTIFPIIHKFSLGIPRKINLICSRLFLDAFVEKRHKIGVNDIWIVLKELQQEQLIPSNQPTFPELKADAFFDLEDDYTTEVEQSPELSPTAKEIRRPAAPVSDMETSRAPTKRYTRYWFITLSLVGLLAIGVEFYLKNRGPFDSGPLYQRAHQLEAYVRSKFSPQKPSITGDKASLDPQKSSLGTNQTQIATSSVQPAHTEPLESGETPRVSNPSAINQDPQVEMTSEKAPNPIEQTTYADKIETTDDLPGTTTIIDDKSGLAAKESPMDNQALGSSSIDSRETPPAIATTQNPTKPNKIPVRLVLFPYKSMEIQAQFTALLDEVADELKDSQYTVARIVGIIDNRGRGTSDYISNLRAKEVARYLSNRGIAADRLRIEDDNSPQESKPESSENKTSPRPERVVEVTVLVPTGRENQRE